MNIRVNNRLSIKDDSKSFMLIRHYKMKKDDGSVNGILVPAEEVIGYYTRFIHLAEAILDESIKTSDAKTLAELGKEIKEYKLMIRLALNPLK